MAKKRLAFRVPKKQEQEMKRYIIHQPQYQGLLTSFQNELRALGYAQGSIKMYPHLLQEFLYRMEQQQVVSVRKIQQSHITGHHEYLEQRPTLYRGGALSGSSISHHLFAVRLFFEFLERTGQLQANPMSALQFPKPVSKQRTILSRPEINALYAATVTHRERAALALFYGCGLRRNEAVTLNINDIHFGTQLLYVREGKGCKRRVIPMSEKVAADLKNYYHQERYNYAIKNKKEEAAFLLNNKGSRMLGLGYDKLLKEIITGSAAAHLKGQVSLHHLRHSIASHLLENGVPIEYVRDFLGHGSLNVTQIYTHINQRQLQQIK
jgi:integrase/recombinase XerD